MLECKVILRADGDVSEGGLCELSKERCFGRAIILYDRFEALRLCHESAKVKAHVSRFFADEV